MIHKNCINYILKEFPKSEEFDDGVIKYYYTCKLQKMMKNDFKEPFYCPLNCKEFNEIYKIKTDCKFCSLQIVEGSCNEKVIPDYYYSCSSLNCSAVYDLSNHLLSCSKVCIDYTPNLTFVKKNTLLTENNVKKPKELKITTIEEFNQILENRITKMREVLASKGKEYATEDRLYNFRRGAEINHTTPQDYLWQLATKHLVSIIDMVEGRLELTPYLISEKIGDIINYCVLLEALFLEILKNKTNSGIEVK